jgi:hypothetical protein
MTSTPIREESVPDPNEISDNSNKIKAEDEQGLTIRFNKPDIADLDKNKGPGWVEIISNSVSHVSVDDNGNLYVPTETVVDKINQSYSEVTSQEESYVGLHYLNNADRINISDSGDKVIIFPADGEVSSNKFFNLFKFYEAKAEELKQLTDAYDEKLEQVNDIVEDAKEDQVNKEQRKKEAEAQIEAICGDVIKPEEYIKGESDIPGHRWKVTIPDELESRLSKSEQKNYKTLWNRILSIKSDNNYIVNVGKNYLTELQTEKELLKDRREELIEAKGHIEAAAWQLGVGETLNADTTIRKQLGVLDELDEFTEQAGSTVKQETSEDNLLAEYNQHQQHEGTGDNPIPGVDEDEYNLRSSPAE